MSFGSANAFAVHRLSIHVCAYLLAEYVSGLTLQENKKLTRGCGLSVCGSDVTSESVLVPV